VQMHDTRMSVTLMKGSALGARVTVNRLSC
jgi:hypothetical protein